MRNHQRTVALQEEELRRIKYQAQQQQEELQRINQQALVQQQQELQQRSERLLAANEEQLRRRYEAEVQRLQEEHVHLEHQRAAIQAEQLRIEEVNHQHATIRTEIAMEKEQLDRQKSSLQSDSQQSAAFVAQLQEREDALASRAEDLAREQNRVSIANIPMLI